MASNNDSNKNEKSLGASIKEGFGKTVGVALGVGTIAGIGGLLLTGNPLIAFECAKTAALKAGSASVLS